MRHLNYAYPGRLCLSHQPPQDLLKPLLTSSNPHWPSPTGARYSRPRNKPPGQQPQGSPRPLGKMSFASGTAIKPPYSTPSDSKRKQPAHRTPMWSSVQVLAAHSSFSSVPCAVERTRSSPRAAHGFKYHQAGRPTTMCSAQATPQNPNKGHHPGLSENEQSAFRKLDLVGAGVLI